MRAADGYFRESLEPRLYDLRRDCFIPAGWLECLKKIMPFGRGPKRKVLDRNCRAAACQQNER
jgi:hypothetical protein